MIQIEEVLMKDDLFREHFVRKHAPKYELVRGRETPILNPKTASLKKAIDWVVDYIGFPLIEDNFELGDAKEDTPRDRWQKELEVRYGEEAYKFLINNKLRGNLSGNSLLSAVNIISLFLEEEIPELKKETGEIRNLIASMGSNYSAYKKMNINERVEFIRSIEDRVYRTLLQMSSN